MGLAIPDDPRRYSLAWHESVRDASDITRHSCAPAEAQNISSRHNKRHKLFIFGAFYVTNKKSKAPTSYTPNKMPGLRVDAKIFF